MAFTCFFLSTQQRNHFGGVSSIIVKREQEDPSIFAQRFSRSYQFLHLIACRLLGVEDRVPLAIKNCWRSASRNPPYFEYEGAFRSWLVRVLIDEALAILRKCPEPPHASEVLRTWREPHGPLFLLQRTSVHERDNAVDRRIPNRIPKPRSLTLKTSKAKDG